MKKLLLMSVMLSVVAVGLVISGSTVQVKYVPKAQFCANGSNTLCSVLPAYIGPDPQLKNRDGYSGLFGPQPTTAARDVETPFDNMAWQMFIALNWADRAVNNPPAIGLTVSGARVFQTYRRVSSLFGNSAVLASCPPAGIPVFNIGSDGKGNPVPNNEEYLQASTNRPLIDINGNWTIYERRVNDVEANYLLAPNGQASQTLTTKTGQTNFINSYPKGASFPPSAPSPVGTKGSIEIKTSWRIIDKNRGDDPTRYYTQNVIVAVPKDMVNSGQQICAQVTLGLVGMHIIQRNPVDNLNPVLFPQWIWATFEHVDNAPMAQSPCDVSNPENPCSNPNWINQPTCGAAAPSSSVRYSFYNPKASLLTTNIRPAPRIGETFAWNSTAPYSKNSTTAATAMPQATRCFSIYQTTAQINTQWRSALAALNTPFQNYMLIGTQWGASLEPRKSVLPLNAVPALLSNMTLETYIQTYTQGTNQGGPGSCLGCHSGATLIVGNNVTSDFSFLPLLAEPATARSRIQTAR